MSNSRAERSASQAVAALTAGLGTPGPVVYGRRKLSLEWTSYDQTPLSARLSGIGADVTASISLPARHPGQTTEHVMGSIAGASFTATVTLEEFNSASLEIVLYTAEVQGENGRLEPALDMCHTLFSASGREHQTLAAYVSRQLQQSPHEKAQLLASALATTLADHLSSQLPVENGARLQQLAHTRRQ